MCRYRSPNGSAIINMCWFAYKNAHVDLLKILKGGMFLFKWWLLPQLLVKCGIDFSQCVSGVSSDDLRIALQEENIESRPLWKPMHMQPIFASYPYYGNNVAESAWKKTVCVCLQAPT
jgi:hypothetical protein